MNTTRYDSDGNDRVLRNMGDESENEDVVKQRDRGTSQKAV
jgi:hypothetical protein